MKFGTDSTIAAISTAPGMGAIGIIRLTGKDSLPIALRFLHRNNRILDSESIRENPKRIEYCDFYNVYDNVLVDKIVFFYSRAPHSFTGEDMVELHFHGNMILLRTGLDLLYRAGARPAMPGEFSKRSFLNGKINLTEAEAIGRIIHSRSRFELELAQKNLFGELSKLSSRLRSELVGIKAECEAEIDFSTEDLTYESLEERRERINRIRKLCETLLDKSQKAENLIGRSKVVLFGEPNVGKSSLMNCLLGRERSIISDQPGTTRDYISEDMNLSGIPIQLVDTAGVRTTEDRIEKLGIEKTLREAESAHLKLFLIDTSRDTDWKEFIAKNKKFLESSVVIANKTDISHPSWDPKLFTGESTTHKTEILPLSCKTGNGIPELIRLIEDRLSGSESIEEFVILEDRQKFHVQKIAEALTRAEELMLMNTPAEIVIKEIDSAVEEVSAINGEITTEEVLGRIFSVFCVGK